MSPTPPSTIKIQHAEQSSAIHPASFRDPSGFLFSSQGQLFRQVNLAYQENYTRLVESGLYQKLVDSGLLLPHQEADHPAALPERAYKIIKPQQLSFISYPYEWSFSQLQDAALATLKIQRLALKFGMSLKDSSAYNIQFHDGRPLLIDTLSFEHYQAGSPWDAYRQFCQHFLAPLSLMAYTDVRLSQLMRVYLDGLPLDLTSRLLPARTRLVIPLLLHIHLHAASQKRYAGQAVTRDGANRQQRFSQEAMLGLLDSLENGVRRLRWSPAGSAWGNYYEETNYTAQGLEHKQQLISQFLEIARPNLVWDLGANTGRFSRQSSQRGATTIAFDIDPDAVEKAYLECRRTQEKKLLPLLLDLTNPSPALGWQHQERMAFLERGPAEAILALALVHHLAIANNLPWSRLVEFFARAGHWLIIEFIPKDDSQVQRLLAARQDIFPSYNQQEFETAFQARFMIHRHEVIQDSQRSLYLMEKIDA
jgi:ribosomal protein L11 methylase PrmA